MPLQKLGSFEIDFHEAVCICCEKIVDMIIYAAALQILNHNK